MSEDNSLIGIFIQDKIMQESFQAYPEVICTRNKLFFISNINVIINN